MKLDPLCDNVYHQQYNTLDSLEVINTIIPIQKQTKTSATHSSQEAVKPGITYPSILEI